MDQMKSFSLTLVNHSKEVLIRGMIWAFIGTLYAILFVFFDVLASGWQQQVNPYFFSGVLAGTIGALIYSSMRLAVLMAMIITPVSSLLLLLSNTSMDPFSLILVVGLTGGVIGGLYGYFSKTSRVHRADAKTLTGFSAGFLVSLGYLVIAGQTTDLPLALVIGFMGPLTGFLYVVFVPTFIRYFDNLLPSAGDGALVGMGVSVFLALSIFIMANSINADTAGVYLPLVERVHALIPQAVLGGIIGGGLAGVVSGLFFRRWQDL